MRSIKKYRKNRKTRKTKLFGGSDIKFSINNKTYKMGASKLGSGEFGEVIECDKESSQVSNIVGMFSTNTKIPSKFACKILKTPQEQVNEFDKEVKLMKQLGSHKNIVKMIDAYKQTPRILIVEFCKYGSLLSQLEKRMNNDEHVLYNSKTKTGKTNYSLLLDISNGLAHLHKKNILHRDLATRNILLDEKFVAKISDFGLSEQIKTHQKYFKHIKNHKMAIKWLAPEVLCKKYYKESDIWSFGCIIYEIETNGKTPFIELKNIDYKNKLIKIKKKCKICSKSKYKSLNCSNVSNITELLTNKIKLSKIINVLVKSCLEIDISLRPNINNIVKYLETTKDADKWLGA